MKTYHLQSSFNNGIISEKMKARVDIKQYYQGVLQGENVQCLPQGGVRRRPGSFLVDTGMAATVRLLPFIFNTDQAYLVVIDTTNITIYRDDAVVDTISSPYTTAADLAELDYAQTADTMIIVHEDYQPRTLVRGATDADFSISTITMTYTPQFDFNDASSPTPTSEIQRIDFDTDHSDGDTFKISLEGVQSDPITWLNDNSAPDIAEMEARLLEGLRSLTNLPYTGVSVAHAGGTDDEYDVTFADAAANDWGLMGYVRDTESSATPNNNASITRTQAGVSRAEDVWSATRGWPRTVTFHENRLWFGGSAQRPHTMWGSRVGDFYNFDPGKSRADQAIDITLDTDQINRIQAIVGGRTLQVFTIGGEFAFKQSVTEPITPENVAVLPQTFLGSLRVKPVSVRGATMFLQRTGKSVQEFVYTEDQGAYDATSLTLLVPEILSDPEDMHVQRGTSADDATYVYILNGDGTVAVFNTDTGNNVAAWTKWTCDGTFEAICVVLDEIYAIIKKGSNYYLVEFSASYYTDAGSQDTNATPFSTLDTDLVSVDVDVVIDDYRVMPIETTDAGGVITLPHTVTYVEAGLGFDTTIETMPVVQDQGGGHNFDDEIRVSKVTLELYESMGVKVDGHELPLDKTTPTSGREEITLLGWEKGPTKTITQTDPLPMTVLGINMEVNG